MRAIIFVLVSLSSALALPNKSGRIHGGSYTTIDRYPQSASVQRTDDFSFFRHNCGGTILNEVSILTAAHCHSDTNPLRYRVRLGSTFASSGGVVHELQIIINHPNYNPLTIENDIAVIRLTSFITFTNLIQPGAIAGVNYNVADNQVAWSIGWGLNENNVLSDQLKELQVWSVNQEACRQSYAGGVITENMICSIVPGVSGQSVCTGDSGGPLLHNNVVVGVCSFSGGCGHPTIPVVHARVSRYTNWILANSQ